MFRIRIRIRIRVRMRISDWNQDIRSGSGSEYGLVSESGPGPQDLRLISGLASGSQIRRSNMIRIRIIVWVMVREIVRIRTSDQDQGHSQDQDQDQYIR